MGVYASWVEKRLGEASRRGPRDREYRWLAGLARLRGRLQPARLESQRTLVVADFHPPAAMLFDVLGELPARLAVPCVPRVPIPGVAYSLLHTDKNPLDVGAEVGPEIPHLIDTVVCLLPWEKVTGQTLQRWWRLGIKRCWFMRERQIVGIKPFWAMAFRGYSNVLRRDWRGPRPATPPAGVGDDACRHVWDHLGEMPAERRLPQGSRRITHFIESLTSGGAERQMCNLAIAQQRAGHVVRVLLAEPPIGTRGHYRALLDDAGIPITVAGMEWRDTFPTAWPARAIAPDALTLLPRDLRDLVVDAAAELLLNPPDLLHCWLDHANVAGLLAARVAATPGTLLSLRGMSPHASPRLCTPWLRPWYRFALDVPGVRIVANSDAGARDYESWLGTPPGTIGVLRNAFVPPAIPWAADVDQLRKQLNLSPTTPVVAGVFRLDPEKRPFLFLDVVERLRVRIPNIAVLHAGTGLLEAEFRKEIDRRDLGSVVHLLGQRQDIGVILSASDVLMLVSEMEGTPNAALEAQHFGCVPVLTDVGGARETIVPEETGLLRERDDLAGLADAVEGLLADPDRRARMAQAGRAFVAQRFDPERVLAETFAVYEQILTPARPRLAA